MRVLVSCIPFDHGKSGISVYVREVVRALLEQGHELTLLVEPEATIDVQRSTAAVGCRLAFVARIKRKKLIRRVLDGIGVAAALAAIILLLCRLFVF